MYDSRGAARGGGGGGTLVGPVAMEGLICFGGMLATRDLMVENKGVGGVGGGGGGDGSHKKISQWGIEPTTSGSHLNQLATELRKCDSY